MIHRCWSPPSRILDADAPALDMPECDAAVIVLRLPGTPLRCEQACDVRIVAEVTQRALSGWL